MISYSTQLPAKRVYRVQGFSCAHCAAKFEQNVKSIPGVTDAQVNFGAAKLAVYGVEPTIEQLEKAGAFENLKVVSENKQAQLERTPFWRNVRNLPLVLSVVLLIVGFSVGQSLGEQSRLMVLLYACSIITGGYRLFIDGIQSVVRFRFDMSTLMTIAIIGAAAIGEWGEGATVVILFAISEALERYSMDKARQSIRSLIDLAPKQALVRRENEELTLSVEHIQMGDIMIVKPGQKIAMDGVVIRGISAVNQAAITGESLPVTKTIDDKVFAGTLNEEGLLEVRVTKLVDDTTIAKIIHLVEEAQAERAPSQAFVDRFAKIYTPAILLCGFLVAIVPPLLLNGHWGEWIYRGLALLVVGCPCALVISTPVTLVTAIGNAARHGVLIKGGIYLEEVGLLRTIAFDKTGTLTRGLPTVTDLVPFVKKHERRYIAIAAAIEQNSPHPLASAITRKATAMGIKFASLTVEEFTSMVGQGVRAKVQETLYYMGSPSLFAELLPNGLTTDHVAEIALLQAQGKTVMMLGTEIEVLALFAVADEIRANSKQVIEQLHRMGVKRTVMLTGDNRATATAIGEQIGVEENQAELLPQQKLAAIHELREQDIHVAMVGDGVNDAPALAAATVGIAMGGAGTDTALETADIVLMGDDLQKLPFTIQLSRKALRVIKQNITFSIAIKAAALLLIIPGWLTLWMAIFADMGATLIVMLNGLRLLRINRSHQPVS